MPGPGCSAHPAALPPPGALHRTRRRSCVPRQRHPREQRRFPQGRSGSRERRLSAVRKAPGRACSPESFGSALLLPCPNVFPLWRILFRGCGVGTVSLLCVRLLTHGDGAQSQLQVPAVHPWGGTACGLSAPGVVCEPSVRLCTVHPGGRTTSQGCVRAKIRKSSVLRLLSSPWAAACPPCPARGCETAGGGGGMGIPWDAPTKGWCSSGAWICPGSSRPQKCHWAPVPSAVPSGVPLCCPGHPLSCPVQHPAQLGLSWLPVLRSSPGQGPVGTVIYCWSHSSRVPRVAVQGFPAGREGGRVGTAGLALLPPRLRRARAMSEAD